MWIRLDTKTQILETIMFLGSTDSVPRTADSPRQHDVPSSQPLIPVALDPSQVGQAEEKNQRKRSEMRSSPHTAFFSSLKQVEKRLASDTRNSSNSQDPVQNLHLSTPFSNTSLTSSMHLNYQESNSFALEESDLPQEFLSHSPEFAPTPKNQSPTVALQDDRIADPTEGEEFEQLRDLLDLSKGGFGAKEGSDGPRAREGERSCCCDGGFCSKIGRAKGPKCETELRRLERWIEHFSVNKKEPLRLAHLLLGRAASMENGFAGMEFPVSVEHFLNKDPP